MEEEEEEEEEEVEEEEEEERTARCVHVPCVTEAFLVLIHSTVPAHHY